MKRALGSLAAVVLAVALPACGNSGGKTNEAKKAAGLVPKDALAYVSVAVNPSDSQKSDIDGILSKFPKASKKTFDAAKVDWYMVTYARAVHAFTNPEADSFKIPGIGYNEKAAKRSWDEMGRFFQATMK